MPPKKTKQGNSVEKHAQSAPMVSVDLLEKLIRKILKEVIKENAEDKEKLKVVSNGGGLTEENMAKADEKIRKALKGKGDSDDDGDDGGLKPKYENIDALLRYVESPDGATSAGGVKLVIMNFND